MKNLKALLDFYIHSSIHVAFAIYALVRMTEISLHLDVDESLSNTVFFGTIVGYNFLKYFEVFQKGTLYWNKNKLLIGLTFFSLIATIFYFLQLSHALQVYFIKIGAMVALYPFLRKFGFWKLFLVSLCVSAITVYATILNAPSFSNEYKIILLQRFLIVIALLIPFEIIDSQTDAVSLKTIPQRFGILKTKVFGIILLVPFVGLEFFKVSIEISSFIIAFLTVLFIWFTDFNRDKYYTTFWVESVPLFWLVLAVLFR